MKFSIVITTYNRLSLLRRAINTALGQTIPCEVIVVDDCSTDGTQEYVANLSQSLAPNRLVYQRNANNLGHSASVNAGVARATGDWIKLMDDDDYLAKNCIAEIREAIALRPQAAICSVQAAQVDENGVQLSLTRRVGPGKAFYIPQEDLHYGMLLELVPFGTPIQVAFRRHAFLESGGWDYILDKNYDDIDSWIKIARFGDGIFINQCLAYRTVWHEGINRKFSLEQKFKTNLLIKKKIHSLVCPQPNRRIPSLSTVQTYLQLHWGLIALKQGNFSYGISTLFPAVFSWLGWQLFFYQLAAKYPGYFGFLTRSQYPIRRLILLEN